MKETPSNRNFKFGPKPALASLAAITLLAVILRYPANHERGVDSFTIHALSGLIVQTGSMGWLVSPLSYFGFAPFSYPPAVPVSIATFASVSGLNVEAAGLVYSLLLGATVTVTSFLFGREALGNNPAALVLTSVLSAAGGIVAFTDWNLSARGTFVAFVPLVLGLLIKVMRRESAAGRTQISSLLLASVPLILVHFLWLLFFPMVAGTAVVYRIAKTHDSLLRRRLLEHSRSRVVLVTQAGIGIAVLAVLATANSGLFSLSDFPQLTGTFLPNSLLVRVGVEYATTMGLAIVAFPLGIWQLRVIAERSRRYALTATIVGMAPLAIDPVYGILLATPIILLVSALGLARLGRVTNQHRTWAPTFRAAAVVAALCLVILVPYAVTVPRNSGVACNQPGSIDDQTYAAALYLRNGFPGSNFTFVSDDPLNTGRIEAISGIPSVEPILSIGTLGYPWLAERNHVELRPSDDPLGGLVSQQQLLGAKEWIPAASPTYGYFAGKHTALLIGNLPDSAVDLSIRNAYVTRFAVQVCPGGRTVFFAAVDSEGYLLYANPVQRVFTIP